MEDQAHQVEQLSFQERTVSVSSQQGSASDRPGAMIASILASFRAS